MRGSEIDKLIAQVLQEVEACVGQIPGENLIQAGAMMEAAPRVFVAGAGRSGLCMRALGMRLMHLGKTAFVVSETTTPSIAAEDLLVLGSGSGQTTSLLVIAERAQQQGAKTLLFTTDASSPLAELADHLVIIPAPSYKETGGERELSSRQPLGTLFEQSLFVLCDALVLRLMQQTGVTAEQMSERHANLE